MKSANFRVPADDKKFSRIKDKVLGKKYELSLVFAKDSLMRRLNRVYRGKDKTTNVLAFPISKTSGEIFINPSRAKPFGIKYLFIHALLHLKGMEHGDIMDFEEEKLLRKIDKLLHGTSDRSWN